MKKPAKGASKGSARSKARARFELSRALDLSRGQRAILAALVLLLTAAWLYGSAMHAETNMIVCEEIRPGAVLYVNPCHLFDSFLLKGTLLFDEYIFKFRLWFGQLGLLLAAFVYYPEIPKLVAAARTKWRDIYTPISLAAVCAMLGLFILYFGNRQFGGFDLSILVESGWRLVQGQLPYRDFVCTLPPGFYLGIKWAFLIFGVRWTGMLWGTVVLAVVTFLWIYALLVTLLENKWAAFLTSLSVQGAANLLLCYWWYNNVTNLTATVFLLSCLGYLKKEKSLWMQLSFATSLALLGLMKPNIAGLTGIAGVLVLLVFLAGWPARIRMLLLALSAVGMNLLILTANHISIAGMLASYREVAQARGQVSVFGFEIMRPGDRLRVYFCLLPLAVPFLAWWSRFRAAWRDRNWQMTGACVLMLAAPAICMFGMLTNGEFKDVEWPMVICAGVLLLFAPLADAPPVETHAATERWRAPLFVCFLVSLFASDIYAGVVRYRVATMGRHTFFEWNDFSAKPGGRFFADMHASERFQRVISEVEQVKQIYPGPYYFGSRMEFGYAAFGVPSPLHMPIWWDPGTAFAMDRQPEMQEAFKSNRFRTMIFVKYDAVYYDLNFIEELKGRYTLDERFRELTVFHSDTPGGAPKSSPSK